jgi:addiction module HigA family antidote
MIQHAIHPGDVLADELEERGISAAELARQIQVPANRISQLLRGKRAMTGDTALRLGHWLGMNPQFWMNLQSQFDLMDAKRRSGADIDKLPSAAA